MLVNQLIASKRITCTKKDNLITGLNNIGALGGSAVPVVNEKGKVEGVFTINSLVRAYSEQADLNTAIDKYVEKAVLVNEKASLAYLLDYPLSKIVIVNSNNNFVGVASQEKIATSLLKQRDSVSINLNAVLDTSNNCILSINSQGSLSYLNKAAAELLEVEAAQALGQDIEELIPHTRLPEIVRLGKAEIGHRFTFGEKTFITNRTPIIQKGKIVGALAIFQDITELQAIMEELTNVKQFKDILETVVDNDYDCLVVVNADGMITMFNKAYENFLGIPREAAIGKHVTKVIENTRMHIIAKTGKAEMADLQKIKGQEMICNRIPIKKDGKIWGALGKVMFKDFKEFTALIEKFNRLQNELEYYKDVVQKIQGAHYTFANIIGDSRQIMEIKTMAQKLARSNSTVLITGESGTGKELFAHALHYESPRKYGPFIKVNCSAIPENLLESELFGYDEGAFTGAKRGGKLGKFELANNGTIFLDEIGDMPLNMQVKLLRVLQEKEIERVGGTKTIPVDVRVIAATNQPLEELVREEKFRMDLYYRLNVVELKIPPLRHRKEDIPQLSNFLINKLSLRMGCQIPVIEQKTMDIMMSYHWPGNIRELENVLERCLNFVENGIIRAANLPFHIKNAELKSPEKILLLKELVEETECMAVSNALEICRGNKIKAAKMLGISRAGIYQKIEKYRL
ncbi:MAG: sigma 54-interacting transcriptional regulator [Peptococcaceae bacterium]